MNRPRTSSRTSPRFASWSRRCGRPSSRASVTGLALALALSACSKRTPSPREAFDQRCTEAVADGRVAEARTWLADPAHKGLDVAPPQMRDIAERFYKSGAPRVLAAWNQVEADQVCALFVVDLPTGPARAAVFATYAALPEVEPVTDVGQRCLVVPLE